jgi:hypothetical protein
LKPLLQIECARSNERLLEWPIQGIVYDLPVLSNSAIDQVVIGLFNIIKYCFEIELPHNIFITRNRLGDGIRVILWTREAEFGAKNDLEINAAFCEFSGFFICKTKQSFEEITEDSCIKLITSLDTKLPQISKIL